MVRGLNVAKVFLAQKAGLGEGDRSDQNKFATLFYRYSPILLLIFLCDLEKP